MLNRFRKKGSVILLSLLVFIGVFVIAAIFINLSASYEVMNRLQNAADMGAKVRAQAVDIALKERYGYVETLHSGTSSYNGDNVQDRSSFPEEESGYTNPVYNPNSETYRGAAQDADTVTKDAIIEYMNANIGVNTSGTPQVSLEPENICVSVRPLPTNASSRMDFSCTAQVNGENVTIEAKNTPINGLDNPINKGPEGVQVMNVVYVAIAVEHRHFIYEALQSALHGSDETSWDSPPVRIMWSTAYPQIDACTTDHAC